ncbi:hypothetical protein TrLO_g10773 [Triparma laevis f. longispina]|uniref:NADP-dependent oxidoreductase domain-containing protein n=2 Tax=Triparma laevis TaxID=1534972 RepID=A0A9W7FQW5_9STRA|nr:hypothetical protein TrLO_g10773 [Triparma laevis f. longispina]
MGYCRLGDSDLIVSKVCMGTMTFGRQNTLEEGVEQLNLAFDNYGINFVDTAEMYPVPTNPETAGDTDRVVAEFLKGRKREDVVLATKVSGTSERINWLRGEKVEQHCKLNKEQIEYSIDASLERLGTSYIDLLQIHWPDRYVGGLFGQPDYDVSKENPPGVDSSFEEQLSALNDAIKAGKVRYVGVSNETPFGVMEMCYLNKRFPELYPKIVSIQNSYSLIVRKDYEAGLTEVCSPRNMNVGLLAYSPLAGGILSGKYAKDEVDEKARLNLFPGFMARYKDSQVERAVKGYSAIAEKQGLTPTQLALAWCYHKSNVASSIIGATSIEQLEENIKAYDIVLDEGVLTEIDGVYKDYTDPTKAYKNK